VANTDAGHDLERNRSRRNSGIVIGFLAFAAMALTIGNYIGCRLAGCRTALTATVDALLVAIVIVTAFYIIPDR
jgi:hypothetical protein